VIFHLAEPSPGSSTPPEPLFLLLDYGRHWDFAKGHVEKGEDDLAAATRELLEETGIADAKIIPGFQHEVTYYFKDKRHGLIKKTVAFFLGQTPNRNVRISHEHVGFDFLPLAEATKRLTYPSARQILRAAWEQLQQPAGPA